MAKRWLLPVLLVVGFVLSFAIPQFNLVNPYIQLIMMYVGINIILTISLNLINGYMGEFSVGHAGFMAVGAYIAPCSPRRSSRSNWIAWLVPAHGAGRRAGCSTDWPGGGYPFVQDPRRLPGDCHPGFQ